MAENEQKTAERKKRELYENQKKTLDTFLERHAITRAQYEKSLGDLTKKMGMTEELQRLQKDSPKKD